MAGLLALSVAWATPAAAADTQVQCRFSDKRFTEISGMTYSQRHPGVIYVHNDSGGGPRIYAVDSTTCRTLATLTLSGAQARDLEAIGSGRDAQGRPILWVGDIGDNLDSWSDVRLLRVREPKVLRDQTLSVRTYRIRYPDGSHNAEALLTDPSSTRVWIVTKKLANGAFYELPTQLRADRVNVARRVAQAPGMVTDGAMSPDGSRFALRDYVDAAVFEGRPPGRKTGNVYLPYEFQGEALTWTSDGRALLAAGERDNRLYRVPLDLH
jgi:hypothetical protein